MVPPVLFFLKIAWAIQGLFCDSIQILELFFSSVYENGIGILVGIALNVY